MTEWLSSLPRTRKIDPLPPPPDRSVDGRVFFVMGPSSSTTVRMRRGRKKRRGKEEEEAIIIPSMSQVALAGSGWSLPASVRGFSKLTGVKMLRRRKLEKF